MTTTRGNRPRVRNAAATANSSGGRNIALTENDMPSTTAPAAIQANLGSPVRRWRTVHSSASAVASWNGTALSAADHQVSTGSVSGA